MKTYLVGGAVRDALLGVTPKERDWVVVGGTPKELLDLGYTQVGKDFPVFLHPESKEEYALARTERKAGHGYTGFTVYAAPDVTLEDDLIRRDLTINAIAQDEAGDFIDPFDGQRDIENRVLRHISDAFAEDPLRVLRVARFAARFAHLGFTVADETRELMRQLSSGDELSFIASERVWVETEKALSEQTPQRYIEELRACGALARLFPEVDALFRVPQRKDYHPEVDTGVHTLLVLEAAARMRQDSRVAFAALTHDLGKGVTPEDVLPSHRGHEAAGLPLVEQLCDRIKVPNAHRKLALVVCEHHLNVHRAFELKPSTVLKLLESTGAFREGNLFEEFLIACKADSRGRTGFEDVEYTQADFLAAARDAAAVVNAADVKTPEMEGKAIGEAITRERIARIRAVRSEGRWPN